MENDMEPGLGVHRNSYVQASKMFEGRGGSVFHS